jgi:hypothetical protein
MVVTRNGYAFEVGSVFVLRTPFVYLIAKAGSECRNILPELSQKEFLRT